MSIEQNKNITKKAYLSKELYDKIRKMKASGTKKPIKTRDRRSTILTDFIGLNLEIYNGKTYIPLFIKETMIGHKLGEFIPTRTFKKHSGVKGVKK